MLDQIKSLYDLGFSLLWLHPKSKAPIGMGWTKKDRPPWDEFKASFRSDYNVGVRLGKTSRLAGGYLCVVDCDVKSTDPKHREEMEAKLRELGLKPGPVSITGRGNGSRHIFCVSPEPLNPFRYVSSFETVKVKMPSAVRPSRSEKQKLSAREIKEGFRLRRAWEISVMGERQQVVLPPSIHPDSGKPYRWETVAPTGEFPVFDPAMSKAVSKKGTVTSHFVVDPNAVEIDLTLTTLPAKIVEGLISGEGVEDRSAFLFEAAIYMLRDEWSDADILSVLTNRSTYCGKAAFEHTKTGDRARAMQWVDKYTLQSAKLETLASEQFKEPMGVEIPLSSDAAQAQEAELLGVKDWRMGIERSGPGGAGPPKGTIENIIKIIKGESNDRWAENRHDKQQGTPEVRRGVIRQNDFAHVHIYGEHAPWGGRIGAEISDIDLSLIKIWLGKKYRFEPSSEKINEAVSLIAHEHRFHPVRDYLDALQWDGRPRLATWLRDYLGATGHEPYLASIGVKTLCAMVARVMHPGCKFDHVLILEGNQGKGKSTAVSILAGEWYSNATINFTDKDSVTGMRGIWGWELGELGTMQKTDVELLKDFISRQNDRIRLPYGRRTQDFPRECVFIGTTNTDEYLKDYTGNRRFWPVKIVQCKWDELRRDRDQLFAEAVVHYSLGERLYLDDPEVEKIAREEQAIRVPVDTLEDDLRDFLNSPNPNFPTLKFTLKDLYSEFGPWGDKMKMDMGTQRRIGICLRMIGYEKKQIRIKSGNSICMRWAWTKKE